MTRCDKLRTYRRGRKERGGWLWRPRIKQEAAGAKGRDYRACGKGQPRKREEEKARGGAKEEGGADGRKRKLHRNMAMKKEEYPSRFDKLRRGKLL